MAAGSDAVAVTSRLLSNGTLLSVTMVATSCSTPTQ